MRVHVWPLGGGEYTGVFHFFQPQPDDTTCLTISARRRRPRALLGCTGKSAQIPLYVWLPDAMAGPTPVSALIHAATMVTAGVYLVCRLSFVFVLSPFTMMMIAIVGAATALFAATIALVQNDIKKVLAYSTSASSASCSSASASGRSRRASSTSSRTPSSRPASSSAPAASSTRCTPASTTTTSAGHAQHGRPAQVHAAHVLDVLAATLAIIGFPADERLLLEGRDPLPRVRRPHGQPGSSKRSPRRA
jgi:hypothetical protein